MAIPTTVNFAVLPQNVIVVDTAIIEMQLHRAGRRTPMESPQQGKPRQPGTQLSLLALLKSLGVDVQCALHNAGNDAYASLLALQLLLEKQKTAIPSEITSESVSQEQSIRARAGATASAAQVNRRSMSPVRRDTAVSRMSRNAAQRSSYE